MFQLSKRHFAGHGPVPPKSDLPPAPPVDPKNEGRTGYGELRGELTSMYGDSLESVTDYPKSFNKLQKGMWYNYSHNSELPKKLFNNTVNDNRRIWQSLDIERMLDHQPPHEIHSSELPDYHYWPSIQNELNHKPTSKVSYKQYIYDLNNNEQNDLPRFLRTGIPKTPKQEQDWYIPLDKNGNFNWKENIRKNGYNASLFSKQGWNKRYLLALNKPTLPFHLAFGRNMLDHPHIVRSQELPFYRRVMRHVSGSTVDRHFILAIFYCGALLYACKGSGHWNKMVWDNEIYNYDVAFSMTNRTKGGFHGIV